MKNKKVWIAIGVVAVAYLIWKKKTTVAPLIGTNIRSTDVTGKTIDRSTI